MTFRSFAGGRDGHFFAVTPDHIQKNLPPGFSPLPIATPSGWVMDALLLKHIWASPNLVWSVMALLMYFMVPYDLSATSPAVVAPLSLAFFYSRFPLWFFVVFGYTGFWHVTLYHLGWAERPFIPNRVFQWGKVAHNCFWSLSGVIIWVAFENVFAYLWATGRLSFVSDTESFSSVWGVARFMIGLILIPLWRDFHFYFAHRLLHYKPLFQQVHSLHHRNTDIEPFAGLCMHPIEHLYYYSCILPSLVFFASPFHFLWNGVHLLIAPGASHSGWEDHFQADNFHYMHHRYFECNYAGFGASFMDNVFGSFTEKFKEKDGVVKAREDAKSTLAQVPTLEFTVYLSLCAVCVGTWAVAANNVALTGVSMSVTAATLSALLCGAGPVVVACAMTVVQKGVGGLLQPFQKQSFFANAVHVVVGQLFCALPVAWFCYLCLI